MTSMTSRCFHSCSKSDLHRFSISATFRWTRSLRSLSESYFVSQGKVWVYWGCFRLRCFSCQTFSFAYPWPKLFVANYCLWFENFIFDLLRLMNRSTLNRSRSLRLLPNLLWDHSYRLFKELVSLRMTFSMATSYLELPAGILSWMRLHRLSLFLLLQHLLRLAIGAGSAALCLDYFHSLIV